MTHKVDDTLRDDGRREISQVTGREVDKVVPEHFKTDYPKLVSFLEQYYHFEDSDGSPSRLVNDLFYTRDINQVDESLLTYLSSYKDLSFVSVSSADINPESTESSEENQDEAKEEKQNGIKSFYKKVLFRTIFVLKSKIF